MYLKACRKCTHQNVRTHQVFMVFCLSSVSYNLEFTEITKFA